MRKWLSLAFFYNLNGDEKKVIMASLIKP